MDAKTVRIPGAIRVALGYVALLAVAWSVYEGAALSALAKPLKSSQWPRGGVHLQLERDRAEAFKIRRDWACQSPDVRPDCRDVTGIAQQTLERDTRFILSYTTAWVLVAVWAAWVVRASRRVTAFVVVLVVAAGLCDLAGNWFLGIQLGNAGQLPFARVAGWWPQAWQDFAKDPTPQFAHAVTLARVASMSTFVFLLVGVLSALALAGGAVRLVWRRRPGASAIAAAPASEALENDPAGLTFQALIRKENAGIFQLAELRAPDEPTLADNAPADEPRILFRAGDVIGLALSGGGIRSATFNLGLLQGVHRLNLLPMFDYVSTVSGGGYVGSFWSEWLVRRMPAPTSRQGGSSATPDRPRAIAPRNLFPSHRDVGSGPQDRVDTNQERHLREFAGFLAPRWGFFEVETWTALVAMVSGLLPALAIAVAAIGIVLVGWLSLTFPLASSSPLVPVPFIVIVTAGTLYALERMWNEFKAASSGQRAATGSRSESDAMARGRQRYIAFSVAALVLVGILQYLLPGLYPSDLHHPIYAGGALDQAPGDGSFARWWPMAGIDNPRGGWLFSPRLFDFSLVWPGTALILVVVRLSYPISPSWWARESLAAYDRVLMRILGPAVLWCGLALLWHLAVNVDSLAASASAAIVSAGVFATLRNWIGLTLRRPKGSGAIERLKPYLPQVLAYLTLVLAAAAIGRLLIEIAGTDWLRWWAATLVMLGLIVLGLFINPGDFGLHAFYRERISRAYAGACNLAEGAHAGHNRGTDPRVDDDRLLKDLVARPLHLVCCAANDLSGDPVETLSRGARSAVLSKHGFSVGRFWGPVDDLRLGSAVTASAAAFNSNMGGVSMQLGPAVSFLMTALNLRLGLWVRHPAAPVERHRRWPGLLLYREMLGLTSASGALAADGTVPILMRDVHLSDGGHFENLGVYELVRRHCRYVLMSDCGADPTVAFDDLGNALRRIREDFGVDISLDVEPLRPGPDGRSRQHVVVGTIHYSATDHGILLYVKPSLTGDEPPDVLQYKTRNATFPHESTGDQFYDEAQWESYRRLGLHAAECIFTFVPPSAEPASGTGAVSTRERATARPLTGDWVFAEAAHTWGPTPVGLVDRILEMTARFAQVEAELRQNHSRGLVAEVFPEIASMPPGVKGAAEKSTPQELDTVASDLSSLLRVMQLMENVWMACSLDQWWDHPLNLGWINVFARWATAPTFRLWWPLLGPQFSPGFRRFVDERFPMPPRPTDTREGPTGAIRIPQRGRLLRLSANDPPGLAATWWQHRSTQPRNWQDRILYQNVLDLPWPGGSVQMQVAIAAVKTHETSVGWTSDDFFVPPSLWGAGIGWYFLDDLLNELSRDFMLCYVIVKAPPIDASHKVAMDDRRSFIEQYRKIGFRQELTISKALDSALVTALGFETNTDTLLVLDLVLWAKRRGVK